MFFSHARACWHDAFDPAIGGIDPAEAILNFGITSSAKDRDMRIVSHVEKGIIQQAIEVLKSKDKVAWAFGMIAYAPIGTATPEAHAAMRQWFMEWIKELDQKQKEGERKISGSFAEAKILLLARIATMDVAHEDVTGQRRRHDYSALGGTIGITDRREYKNFWHLFYVLARDKVLFLPERALTPVAGVVNVMKGMNTGNNIDHEKLNRLMKVSKQYR